MHPAPGPSRLAAVLFCEEGCLWGRQLDRPARNPKHALSLMMDCPWPVPARINPRLDHLQDEEVVLSDQSSINHLAFQTGITFGDERGLDDRRRHRREAKGFELVHRPAGSVSAMHHFFRQVYRRHIDHAFSSRPQHSKCVVLAADHATYERRHKLHHRVPRHGHDVRPSCAGRCDQHDRARFQQPIHLCQRKLSFFSHNTITQRKNRPGSTWHHARFSQGRGGCGGLNFCATSLI